MRGKRKYLLISHTEFNCCLRRINVRKPFGHKPEKLSFDLSVEFFIFSRNFLAEKRKAEVGDNCAAHDNEREPT